MKPRPLAVINAIGCLALTTVLVHQWAKERGARDESARLRADVSAARTQAETSAREAAALRRDIDALKDSLGSIRIAANAAAEANARAAGMADDLELARAQLAKWQAAIAARDATIRKLDGELAAARARLDEAVTKMKRAGAR